MGEGRKSFVLAGKWQDVQIKMCRSRCVDHDVQIDLKPDEGKGRCADQTDDWRKPL